MANGDANIKYIENTIGSSTLVLNDYMFRLKTEKRRKQLLVLRKANMSCQKKSNSRYTDKVELLFC